MPDPAQTLTPNTPQQPTSPLGGPVSPAGGPPLPTTVQEPKTFTPEDIQNLQVPNEPPVSQPPLDPLQSTPLQPLPEVPQTPLPNTLTNDALPPTQASPQNAPYPDQSTLPPKPVSQAYQATTDPLTGKAPQQPAEAIQDLSSLTGEEPSGYVSYQEQPPQPEQPTPPPDYNAYQNPVLTPQPPVDQTQNANWGTTPAAPPPYQPVGFSQTPPPPEEPKKGTPPFVGFLIGGVIALILIGVAFGAYTIINKNKTENVPTPPPSTPKPSQEVSKKTPTPAPLTPTKAPTPTPTPKNAETYINSEFKYQFQYPLGLSPVTKVASDPRFPKALDIEKLTLTQTAATSSAYIMVWPTQNDVPTYITDGQSQSIKVNIYNTIRFTLMKPGSIRETHYLTQKFENVYDIALEDGGGQISTPAFEKILSTFTFSDQLPVSQPTPTTQTQTPPTSTTSASPNVTSTPSPSNSLSTGF